MSPDSTSEQLTYRGGVIEHQGCSWGWDNFCFGANRVRVFPHPKLVVATSFWWWRVRSDDEALCMLCEKVDAYLDEQARKQRMIQERQTELRERERIMQDLDRP